MRNLNIICIEEDFVPWPAPVITDQVVSNAVNRKSRSLNVPDSKFQSSKQNCCQNIIYNSNSDLTLKRYQKEYFLN